VVTDTELPAQRVLELLERLVRQSLVVADQAGGHTRYRMLETLRQYATGKLADAGETTAMDAAHAAYFLSVGEQAETGLRGPAQARWLAALRTEHANVRAALSWMVVTDGQVDQAQRLAGSLGLYWHLGRHLEGREVLRRVMTLSGGSAQSWARALQAVSLVERPRACIVHPSAQCAAAARESLTVFQLVGDRGRAAFSELLLAVEGISGGAHPDADVALLHADNEFAALGDDWGRAVAAFVRMEKLTYHADLVSVRAAAADASARFRVLKDGWGLSAVLYHFGWALTRFGAPADAVPVLQEAIDVASAAGVYNTAQWATADLGLALLGWAGWTRRPPISPAPARPGIRSATMQAPSCGPTGRRCWPRASGSMSRLDSCSSGLMTVSSGWGWLSRPGWRWPGSPQLMNISATPVPR
jgi:hypothetical protein